ncbi:MAG: DNA-3-methyladenine glycosylase [Bradymonadaceae bacterium]|nr:DNA-3-methyladenine glycosylase [Lujinxingiaceae bacterium]
MTDQPTEPFSFVPGEILAADFYEQEVHALACALLGCVLVRHDDDAQLLAGRIVEVEVYTGPGDLASHARTGKPTARNRPMFGPPGTAYIYKIYGMYDCLNIVAEPEGHPAAILIRALEPLASIAHMATRRALIASPTGELTVAQTRKIASGPGKLCQAMAIDKHLNALPLDSPTLCLIAHTPIDDTQLATSPRIGLNPKTCGEAHDWPWRYTVAGSKYLSR